jgi:hypothetical protein
MIISTGTTFSRNASKARRCSGGMPSPSSEQHAAAGIPQSSTSSEQHAPGGMRWNASTDGMPMLASSAVPPVRRQPAWFLIF